MQKRLISSLFVAALAVWMLSPIAAQTRYTFTRIVDNTGPFQLNGSPAAINEAGEVTFGADLSTGSGIFVGRGGPITTVADTSDDFRFFGFSSIDGRSR